MNKKKLSALLVAGTLTMGIVGGTFAWLTSGDNVSNAFKIGDNIGVKVMENFVDTEGNKILADETGVATYNKELTPGTEIQKVVWVNSTEAGNQFVRAKIVTEWKKDGQVVTHYKVNENGEIQYTSNPDQEDTSWTEIPDDLVEIVKSETIVDSTDAPAHTWTKVDEYYYYNTILEAGENTSNLLTGVKLDGEEVGSDDFKFISNLEFDVKIEAESIQVENGAIDIEWENAPQVIKALNESTSSGINQD